ncbi:DUF4411 family protein [Marinobacter subterrani]|uniref:DUF4411 family protein n=1 Tax=Marinobacter subterrani TaxID=1658765 RepID=UPI002353FFDC|nr:DUF4411 family protein [Marinobacter subterrani]
MPGTQNKIYLLDANVIIHAHDYYYHMDRVPEFWGWILHHAENGSIKMPIEIMDEVTGGPEAQHANWIKSAAVKSHLALNESWNSDLLNQVIKDGYVSDPTEDQVELMGQDPFLITYALGDPLNRIVISNEVSKPAERVNFL